MKRLSISVAIICDGAPGNFQQATAIRSVLETFGIQVYFDQLLHKQNLLDFLGGNYADCDYVIWYCYGCPDAQGREQINFQVVHQKDNDSNWIFLSSSDTYSRLHRAETYSSRSGRVSSSNGSTL